MTTNHHQPARLGYSIKEACELTTLSRSSIYNHISAKRLKVVHVGGRTIIPADALHALLSNKE